LPIKGKPNFSASLSVFEMSQVFYLFTVFLAGGLSINESGFLSSPHLLAPFS